MPPKKKAGRRNRTPDKLTPEVQKVVIDSIAAGVPQRQAADRAGIHEWTIWKWMKRGKEDKTGVYRQFFQAMKKAEADRLAASVARIGKAAQGGQVIDRVTTETTKVGKDGTSTTTKKTVEKVAQGQWTADAWFLERRHPDQFASNRSEIKNLEKLTIDQGKRIAELERLLGGPARTETEGSEEPEATGPVS